MSKSKLAMTKSPAPFFLRRLFGRLLAGLVLTMSSGCAINTASADARAPAWVQEPHREHPEGHYLVAVGTGGTAEGAEKRALAALATQIKAKVESREVFYSASASGESPKDDLARLISIETQLTLIGARIVERFENASGQWHALAALERRAGAMFYENEAARLRAQRELAMQQAGDTRSTLERVGALREALEFSLKLDEARAVLGVIDPGRGAPGEHAGARTLLENVRTTFEIKRTLDGVLSEVGVAIEVRGEGAEGMLAGAQRAVRRLGMRVVSGVRTDEVDALIRIEGKTERRRSFDRRRAVSAWSAHIDVVDVATGEVVATTSAEGRTEGASAAEAARRAQRELAHAIQRLVREGLE